MAESTARKFSSRHHTFRKYVGFNGCDTGVSYLELTEFIMTRGANVNRDLEELWRRIVFYICISNMDDHLRNHGAVLPPEGWIISPVYDMNPDETGNWLKLNIIENDNSPDLNLALKSMNIPD